MNGPFDDERREFKTRTGHGYVWRKNLALNIGDCVSLMTRIIMLMSVPSHLTKKENIIIITFKIIDAMLHVTHHAELRH